MAGIASRNRCNFFRHACRNDRTAAISAFRTKVNNVIRRFDHIKVMLNYEHAAAALAKALQNLQQALNIRHMQAGGRFVQHIQRASRVLAGKLRRKLYALCFPARKRCGRLSKPHIA